MTLNPYLFADVVSWTDSFALMAGPFNITEKLDDPENWREWAANLIDSAETASDVPNPYEFDDWREWAARLFLTIELQ